MITCGIPAYNEEKSIKRTILTILPQLNEKDELIVVASGCTDNTVEEVKSINEPRIRIIIQKERKGKVSAINIILKEAKGEIIVLCDADVIISKGSIKRLVNHLKDEKVGATCGQVKSYSKNSFFDKVQDAGWIALNEQKIEENKKGVFYALNGYLMAIKRGIVEKINEKFLLDDSPLGWLIKQKGYKIIYDPRAQVYVKAAQNLKDFINQKARNRIGWWQLTQEGMAITERRNIKQLRYLFRNIYFWFYIPLDFFIWIKAYIDFKRKKRYWEKIESSKI